MSEKPYAEHSLPQRHQIATATFVGDPHQQRYDSFLSRFRSFLGEQSEAAEARMALAADHQMVVDGDAQRLGRRFDLARHLDVVARGLGIT
jgi:hypothetical protein